MSQTVEDRAARRRAYYAAHRDEIKGNQHAYRETHREELARKQRAYYAAHRDELKAYHRQYYAAHRDELKARTQRHYENLDGVAYNRRMLLLRRADALRRQRKRHQATGGD